MSYEFGIYSHSLFQFATQNINESNQYGDSRKHGYTPVLTLQSLSSLSKHLLGHESYSINYWLNKALAIRDRFALNNYTVNFADPRHVSRSCTALLFFDLPPRLVFNAFLKSIPDAKKILLVLESPCGHPWLYNEANYSEFYAVLSRPFHSFDHPRRLVTPLPSFSVDVAKKNQANYTQVVKSYDNNDQRLNKACMINLNRSIGLLECRTSRQHIPWIRYFRHGWKINLSTLVKDELCQLYGCRRKIARSQDKLSPNNIIDIYGKGWNGERIFFYNRILEEKPYAGWVQSPQADKQDILLKYKYSICVENYRSKIGYVSEKIFDALLAKCIPLYYGDKHVSRLLPQDLFVDIESRHSLVSSLNKCIAKPLDITSFSRAFDDFICSTDSNPFTTYGYASQVLKVATNS